MRSQIQKKPVSSSYSPPAQKATSWQRPFSDPVHDPKQDGTVQSKIAPGAGFNLLQMKLFPDAPTPVQAKLSVGAPGDKYEQEADSMASKVMTMPAPEKEEPIEQEVLPEEKKEDEVQTKALSSPTIQRETTPEEPKKEEDLPVQAKAESEGKSSHNSNLESQLNGSKGGGSPLPDEVRAFMEPRFGADFSQVRVHTGSEAVQMNRKLNAQAFTHGSDIYYGSGKSPEKNDLTAHELTHVVQQTGEIKTRLEANHSSEQPSIKTSSASKLIQLMAEQNYTPASEEFNHTPGEEEAADIGQKALQTVGYERIIETALEAGFLREISSDESANVQTKLQENQNTIFRQAQAAMTAGQVFTRYAVAAGVASQLDSPAPGPGDVVAIGILIVGLAAAGYVLMSKPKPETLSPAEEEAIREKEAGRPYDPTTYNRARKKQIKNEKYEGERNKNKQRGGGG